MRLNKRPCGTLEIILKEKKKQTGIVLHGCLELQKLLPSLHPNVLPQKSSSFFGCEVTMSAL